MAPLLLAAAVGLAIGLTLGALGGGGSILAVPALVLLLGQDATAATTTSLLVVGISSLVGMLPHARAGRVRVVQALVIGALGTLGSFVGSRLSAAVDDAVLMTAFAALMAVVAVLMLRRTESGGPARGLGPIVTRRPFTISWPRAGALLVLATVIGLLTGFFGVGGGFLVVPALVLVLGFDMRVAVGTSLLVIAVNSATALASRAGGTGVELDWALVLTFTGVTVLGTLAGGRVADRLPTQRLNQAFAGLVLVVALVTAATSVPDLL